MRPAPSRRPPPPTRTPSHVSPECRRAPLSPLYAQRKSLPASVESVSLLALLGERGALAHLFPPRCTRAYSLAMSKDQLYLAGERSTGLDVRTQNVTAALSVANVVKSSLGPVGLGVRGRGQG
jgi:hypothetical protein